MKKILFLLVTISCLVMLSRQVLNAQPQPSLRWFAVQHRLYEDGRDFTRVIIQLQDLVLADISEIRLFEPGSTEPSNLVTKENAREYCENTIYSVYVFDQNYGQNPFYSWSWLYVNQQIGNGQWEAEYYVTWDLYNYPLVPGGTYKIEVDYSSATLERYFTFSDYADFPIVSLVSDKEKIRKEKKGDSSHKLDVEQLADGSLVLRWHAPAITRSDTSARVFVILNDDPGPGECLRQISWKSPTHMGMLIIPSDAFEYLQDPAIDYQGYLGFRVQIRLNDNSDRSYSNTYRYYFE